MWTWDFSPYAFIPFVPPAYDGVTRARKGVNTLPNGETALIPVVMGMGTSQVILTNRTGLPAPAIKIMEMSGDFSGLHCRVIPGKVVFQGVFHKQTYLVGTNGVVFHVSEEEPFSGFVQMAVADPEMSCRLHPQVESIHGNLIDPNTLDELSVICIQAVLLKEERVPFSPHFRLSGAG